MNKKIKLRKVLSTIILIIGILPFLITLITGIYAAIGGIYDDFCFMCTDRQLVYGYEAFRYIIAIWFYLFWPVYIIALIFIVLSIIGLIRIRKISKIQ